MSDIANQIVMFIVTWFVFSFTHPHTTRRSGDPLFTHPLLLSDTMQYIGPPTFQTIQAQFAAAY